MIFTNPHIDKMKEVFDEVSIEDNATIANEVNTKTFWQFFQNVTKGFDINKVDFSSTSSIKHFEEIGWLQHRIFLKTDINAFAFTEENLNYIGLNAGTLFLIRDSFFSLFSTPVFLPNIGDISNEKNTIENFKENYFENLKTPNYNRLMPKCETRKRCADYLTDIAIKFIYYHELSHIKFCHTSYQEITFGLKRVYEFAKISKKIDEHFDDRSMEIEADSGGMVFTLIYLDFLKSNGILDEFKEYHPYLLWIYTIETLFKLLNPNGHYKDYENDSHPNNFIRTLNIYEHSILEAIPLKLIKDEKHAVELFEQTKDLNKIFEQIGFIPDIKDTYKVNYELLKKYRLRVNELKDTKFKKIYEERELYIQNELKNAKENAV
jgi:hypothetical protein